VTYDDLDRFAEGIIRLRAEIMRRRPMAGELPGAELTSPQALALRTIVGEGPLRMGVLASRLGVSVATASRTVDALVARSLVRRESDPADARAVRVAASSAGRRELRVRRQRFVAALESFMNDLSEHERRQLAESLETLNRLLAPRAGNGENAAAG
jgi:DNA-binding MarR family transcriptional regulator